MIIDLIFLELKLVKNGLVEKFYGESVLLLGKWRFIYIRKYE